MSILDGCGVRCTTTTGSCAIWHRIEPGAQPRVLEASTPQPGVDVLPIAAIHHPLERRGTGRKRVAAAGVAEVHGPPVAPQA